MARTYDIRRSGVTWSATCKDNKMKVVSGKNKEAVKARAKELCGGGEIIISKETYTLNIAFKDLDKLSEIIEFRKWVQ